MRRLIIGTCAIFLGLAVYSILLSSAANTIGFEGELPYYLLNKGLFAVLLLLLVLALGHRDLVALNCQPRLSTLAIFWPMLLIALIITAGAEQPATDPRSLILLLLIAVAVGIGEEVLFRGYVLHWASFGGVRFQIVISGTTFGAVHLLGLGSSIPAPVILAQVFFAAALGMIFASARIRDNSLCLPIMVHALFNFLAFRAAGGIHSTFEHPERVIPGMLLAGTIALAWAIVLIYRAPGFRSTIADQQHGG